MASTLKTIKRIDPLSMFKTVFFLDMILIAILAIPMAIFLTVMPVKPGAPRWLGFFPLFMIFAHPLAVAVVSALGALLYNAMAKKTGGIKIEIE